MDLKEGWVYVTVDVRMSRDKHPTPRAIIWTDGRRYEIERVISMRPGTAAKSGNQGDRYTVQINGQQRYLYFEHNPKADSPDVGWWFVERKGVA